MRHGFVWTGMDESLGWDTRSVDEMVEDEAREALWTESGTPPCPVTVRARSFPQPHGGLLPVSAFDRVGLGDRRPLYPCESMPADLVGLCVDYLTRLVRGDDSRVVFSAPLAGARLAGEADRAEGLLEGIHGVDDGSVRAAALLVDYDSAGRRGAAVWRRRNPRADGVTVWNIRRMVARSVRFLRTAGPVVWDGFSFDGAGAGLVTGGSGDFLTVDGLWDMKTSRYAPTPVYTLQVLSYWRLGLRSVHAEPYRRVRRLGIWNPRLDAAWVIDVRRIGGDVLGVVDRDVLGFPGSTAAGAGESVDDDRRGDDVDGADHHPEDAP